MKIIHEAFKDSSNPEEQIELARKGHFVIFLIKSIYGWYVRADGTQNDAILSRGWKEDFDGAKNWAISNYPNCNIIKD